MNLLRNLADFARLLADEFMLWLQAEAIETTADVVPLRAPAELAQEHAPRSSDRIAVEELEHG